MSKDEFIAGYCERSGITREDFDATEIALQCACGMSLCHGWSAVTNHPIPIRNHMELYAPQAAKVPAK